MKQKTIVLTIDGKDAEVNTGQTVLDAARKLGIWIPTLCHHDALEPQGACRLCLVEIEIGGRRRLMASCAYPAAPGLKVFTATKQVIEARKIVAELLLARCSENAQVIELCAKLGVTDTPFTRKTEDCVLCGLCVRICNERMKAGAINFIGRGQTRQVGAPYEEHSEICRTCGACETVCPTDCITVRDTSSVKPSPLTSEWDVGLQNRSAAYIPFPQAVPLSSVIDAQNCAHILTGECRVCEEFCEAGAIDFDQKEEIVEIDVGSIILATGFDLMDPTPMKQFGYGVYPNVYTSLEFERLSNATGPTGGQILIRDGNGEFTKTPESVAILHCIGSRDVNYHEYCSRVCCMYALKYTHLIKEKIGHDTAVYDFYIDQRCYGKGYEEFFRRCQEEGTTFIRGKVAEITDFAMRPEEEGKLVAIAEDTLLGKLLRVPVDMVVLCSAIEARKSAVDVGRIFGVNQGADGFFMEEHPKLGPLNTATDGVFLAGACQSPKDVPDTVAQASGAAAKALSLATRGQVEVPSAISWIDPDICAGCKTCIALCAYSAIEFDERRGVSVVNEAVCKGCGSCSGFCPSGAAQVRHFQKKQLFAEFDGIMDALNAVSM
jgi:heterodisulfide reductase subunit A